MRNALTAFISAASFCALATAASAQTVPSHTGAPLYSYHRTAPQPGTVGSCDIIAGNRVCSAAPAASGYGFASFGPFGALVAAPLGVVAAPFGMVDTMKGQPVVAASGETYAPATGTPPYSYEGQLPPQSGAIGRCDIIAGNRVCMQ